jgi:hypothetical protein
LSRCHPDAVGAATPSDRLDAPDPSPTGEPIGPDHEVACRILEAHHKVRLEMANADPYVISLHETSLECVLGAGWELKLELNARSHSDLQPPDSSFGSPVAGT